MSNIRSADVDKSEEDEEDGDNDDEYDDDYEVCADVEVKNMILLFLIVKIMMRNFRSHFKIRLFQIIFPFALPPQEFTLKTFKK